MREAIAELIRLTIATLPGYCTARLSTSAAH
jgi:hypothetical protein